MFKRLLIATDGSEIATKAVRRGLELAKSLNAQVVIFTATEPWLGLMNVDMNVINFSIEEYEKVVSRSWWRIRSGVISGLNIPQAKPAVSSHRWRQRQCRRIQQMC